MQKIRVAVLGYGHLGKWHAQKVEACAEEAVLVAIVEKHLPAQEAARRAHPGAKVVGELREILADIDAAFVVTPTSTHFELVSFLLKNGKHVFCEKPLCCNDEEGKALRSIAEGNSLLLQVGHSERFHEAWETLRSELQQLPSPYVVRINRVAAFKGRATDVDVVQDLAIHDLDLLVHLFGDRPKSVLALGHKIRTTHWDNVTMDLDLENGSRAFITVGRNHVKELRDLEVVSAAGTLFVDLFGNRILRASSGQFPDGSYVQESTYEKRDHLLLEHQAFYRSLAKGRPAVVGLEDGLRAVHLVDRVLRSLHEGQRVGIDL